MRGARCLVRRRFPNSRSAVCVSAKSVSPPPAYRHNRVAFVCSGVPFCRDSFSTFPRRNPVHPFIEGGVRNSSLPLCAFTFVGTSTDPRSPGAGGCRIAQDVVIGQQNTVQMYAETNAGGTYAGSATGMLDPYFYIDPSVPDARRR